MDPCRGIFRDPPLCAHAFGMFGGEGGWRAEEKREKLVRFHAGRRDSGTAQGGKGYSWDPFFANWQGAGGVLLLSLSVRPSVRHTGVVT